MNELTPLPVAADGRSPYHRRLAVMAIAAAAVYHAFYLFLWCPYDMSADEAHYWDWSRHLDWSYYSKGPLISWIIRAGWELFGGLAMATDGTLMPACRLPAVFFATGLVAALHTLTYQTYRSDRLALGVVLIFLTLPHFTLCSIVITIDSPFLCLWAWALVFGRWAMVDGKRWAWPIAGVLIALGILAKYTMALWLASAGLFLLFTPTHRSLLFRPGFWVMSVAAGLSALPILYWNSQNDWVTFRHVAVQSGVAKSGIRWGGPIEYALGQLGVLLGFWFVAWVGALVADRPRPGVDPGIWYLWWMSVPTFALFGLSSLRASGQVNWPVAAYLSGAVLVAGWVRRQMSHPNPRLRAVTRTAFWVTVVLGALATIAAHNSRMVTQYTIPQAPPETPEQPLPARTYDPTARLKGWQHLCEHLDLMRASLRQSGEDPVIAGPRWDVPGMLGFYCKGHPQAYSLGLVLRDRHSQYDLWHPNPIHDAQAFQGRTFLVVAAGDPSPVLRPAFESVEEPVIVEYREAGRPLTWWTIRVCRGFKGFDPALRGKAAGH